MGKIYKTLIYNNEISLSLLETTDMVNEAIKLHGLSPVAAAALGRTLTAVSFMCSSLKNERDKLSVTIKGGGPGGEIVACGNCRLEIRGYIENPQVNLPLKSNGKLDVGGLVGNSGRMTVIKDIGLKSPYVGTTALVSGEIAEDFTAYYAVSEQQPIAMALGVRIGTDLSCVGAGGVVLEPLPGAGEESIKKCENLIKEFTDISKKVETFGIDKIAEKYFGEYEFYKLSPVYKCSCSKEYIDKVLVSLGKEELKKEIAENGKIEVCCQFCGKKYEYYEKDVEKLLEDNNGKSD